MLMSVEELEKLSTKRLLARLRQLQKCEESFALSDQVPSEYESDSSIEFKDSVEWKTEYSKIKQILDKREHYHKI